MADNIQVEPTLKVTFGFERKLDLGNYNNAVASAYASSEVPVGASQGEYVEAIQALAQAVKAVVFDELGLPTFLDDNGILREVVTAAATSNRVEHAINKAFEGTTAEASGVKIANYAQTSKQPLPDWFLKEAADKGVTEVWDNRDKATGKQPKFKETAGSAKNRGGDADNPIAFWAPRG